MSHHQCKQPVVRRVNGYDFYQTWKDCACFFVTITKQSVTSFLRTRRLNSPSNTLLQHRLKIFACIYLIFVIFDICLANLLRYPQRPVICSKRQKQTDLSTANSKCNSGSCLQKCWQNLKSFA